MGSDGYGEVTGGTRGVVWSTYGFFRFIEPYCLAISLAYPAVVNLGLAYLWYRRAHLRNPFGGSKKGLEKILG